jgi:hypothetical protein
VFQASVILEPCYGNWRHTEKGVPFKLHYVGDVPNPENYAQTLIHRYEVRKENESLYPWEDWAVCEFANTGGLVFHCDEDVTISDNSWVGVLNGMYARIEYVGDTDVPYDPLYTLIYRYK